MASLPDFFLIKPVAWDFIVWDGFNAPRNYTFAPTKLQKHEGIDLRATDNQGNPVTVFAAQRGMVDRVGFSAKGYGNYVRIKHKWGNQTYVTWYGHLSSTAVDPGQFVLAGQKVGVAGTTGFSTGIHLHVTLQHIGHGLKNYVIDDVVDPEPFIQLDGGPDFEEAWFVQDVTIPDGTQMQPDETFVKTWRVRNTGTIPWDNRYTLGFAGDNQMGAADSVPAITDLVRPGQLTNVSVNLIAPSEVGTHRSTWMVRNPDEDLIPQDMYAEIAIKADDDEDTDSGGGTDLARFVADVTIDDGTVIQPGAGFTKTWRVRNGGASTWNTDYSLRFVSDNRMNGPDSVPLTRKVAPGEVVEVSVELAAPTTAGRHTSTWKLHNAQGKPFNYHMYAEIQVPESITPTQKRSEMRYLADVTIPDGKLMQPGEQFVKTWRVRNTGESTWGSGYELAFFADNQMGAPDAVPLPPARPGDEVALSVTLTAPEEPGTFRSTWKARNSQGKFFEFDLFALIEVEDVEEPTQLIDEVMYVADVTIPDGQVMVPGATFVKTWRIQNSGTTTWTAGYSLVHFKDKKLGGPDSVPLPVAKPGESVDVSVRLTAPTDSGLHRSTWKARNPQGNLFDYYLFALVDVVDPDGTYDMLEYMRGDGRVYDLHFDWGGGGTQRIQTQEEDGRFYHVKWQEWEELWADDEFVYRGTDTSPGNNEVYTLYQNGKYGSPWVARKMALGVPFQRTPLVVFRNKSNGAEIPGKKGTHVTWIRLDSVHRKFTFWNGFELADVAILTWLPDAGGKPGTEVLERYYYAKKHGLVAFEGEQGKSVISHTFAPGEAPDLQREVLPWFDHT
jgi:hypothetical protein